MGAGKVLKNFAMQLFVQNLWNFTSEQRSGMIFVLSTRTDRKVVIRPPGTAINTNPYLASFLTGVLVRESHKKGIEGVVGVLESSLAAQGDDLYWRILRPTTLLAAMILVILGQPLIGLLLFLAGFNLFAQGERLRGYARGLKKGKKALVEVITSMTRIKKVLLPLAGGILGFLVSVIIFNLDVPGFLLKADQWFVFLPCFAVSFVFAFFRISPLFNLAANLLIVLILGIFL